MTFTLREDGKRIFFITLAAVIQAINLNTFVHTGGLYPGGVTGIAVLIQRALMTYGAIVVPYSAVNLLLNAFPIWLGFKFVGKKLTIYSLYFIVLSSFLTDLLPSPVITYDLLLISIFGGMINGVVVSMCLLMNANSGGTDFITLYLSEKKGIDAFNIILGVNVIILSLAGLLFGWNKALYSIVFQYFSTQVIHLLYRRYQETTLFIVTDSPHEVYQIISRIGNHSATIMHGEGAYEKKERSVVYSVVSSFETKQIITAIKECDPHAFINSLKTESLSGWFYRKPNE